MRDAATLPTMTTTAQQTCQWCNGRGRTPWGDKCYRCAGTGVAAAPAPTTSLPAIGRRRPGAEVVNEQLQFVLDRLSDLPAALRQTLADHLWSEIPLAVSESAFAAAQAQNVPLSVGAQTSGLELIESVVASIPAGTTGVIQLAATIIPIAAGVTIIAPVHMPLGATDTRSVTFTGVGTGPASIWLTGRQQPTYGVLAK